MTYNKFLTCYAFKSSVYKSKLYYKEFEKGVIIIEMLRNAVTGANIIPTFLLGLVLLYWLTVMIGVLDFSFLDFDFDIDLEGIENLGFLSSLFIFFNVAELPFMLFLSILLLNFWILTMLLYFLPIAAGGFIVGLLLFPLFVLSVFVTKYETAPLKGVFKGSINQGAKSTPIIHGLCTLRCDITDGKMGQAEVNKEDATIVINVKPDSIEDSFYKGETAFVASREVDKNIYYIIKLKGVAK